MNLFLVRHGETNENKEGIVQGWSDTKMNSLGIEQAKQAAEQFNEKIDAIISSDLNRCTETAIFFRDKHPSLPYQEDERLRERYFGEAQGQQKNKRDWEVLWSLENPGVAPAPGAESLDEFDARINNFLSDIKKLPYRSVLVVTHGGTISRMLAITKGIRSPEGHKSIPNSSVTKIDLNQSNMR